jgi:hypothetical protein
MLRAIESPDRAAMGLRSRARVEASFTLEKMTSDYEALFVRLAQKAGARAGRHRDPEGEKGGGVSDG